MDRRNGFMTIYILWLSTIVLTITVTSSLVCRAYIENARQYAEAIRLTYAAESMLYVVWDEFTALPLDQITATKRWYTTDPYQVLAEGDTVELYWVASVRQYPYTGTLWANVMQQGTQIQRTSSLRFQIEPDEASGAPQYSVTKQQY